MILDSSEAAPRATEAVDPAALRVVSMLADLADEELAWIAARCERLDLEPGMVFFTPGEPAEWMFFVLDGVVQVRREQLGPNAPPLVQRSGDISGTIPFSRMAFFFGTARAVTRAVVARYPRFAVVEKTEARAAGIAAREDPRS